MQVSGWMETVANTVNSHHSHGFLGINGERLFPDDQFIPVASPASNSVTAHTVPPAARSECCGLTGCAVPLPQARVVARRHFLATIWFGADQRALPLDSPLFQLLFIHVLVFLVW